MLNPSVDVDIWFELQVFYVKMLFQNLSIINTPAKPRLGILTYLRNRLILKWITLIEQPFNYSTPEQIGTKSHPLCIITYPRDQWKIYREKYSHTYSHCRKHDAGARESHKNAVPEERAEST